MKVLKTLEQPLTEQLVESMVGVFVHVPTNLHLMKDEEGEREENVWFAGQVAGYERAVVKFDYVAGAFLEEARVFYNLLLTDGMGYVLGEAEQVEIRELEAEEFHVMLQEHLAAENAESVVDSAADSAVESE